MKLIPYFWIFSISLTIRLTDGTFFFDYNSSVIYDGERCNPNRADTNLGVCKSINDCAEIQNSLRNRIYNHTVCGYLQHDQIVCCPVVKKSFVSQEFEDCLVYKTNERGVLRFPKHCPGLVADDSRPSICKFDVCKDLVCCPIQNLTNPVKSIQVYNVVCK